MTGIGRLVRFGAWLAAASGWLAGQAPGQSVWLTGQIISTSPNTTASGPALVFDSQDRPRVVCQTGSGFEYVAGDAAGVIPNWGGWANTGVAPYTGLGQLYLARAGDTLYLGYRPRSASTTVRAAVYDGTSWQPYTLSVTPANLFGLVVDAAGQPWWLIHPENVTYADPEQTMPTWGYSLVHQDAAGNVTKVSVAMATGGGLFTGPSTAVDRPFYQGGHALLDRFGNLHTIQYYPRGGGTLLYAHGPQGGPFQVFDDLEAGWAVKFGRASVTLDPTGLPHIAYTQQWPGYGVKHLAWTGSAWVSEWIEQGGSASGYLGTCPKILVDRVGGLHVICGDPMHGAIKHAWKTQGLWQIETIDTVGMNSTRQLAALPAAAMDSQGGIGVVYWDEESAEYKYAYRLPLDQQFDPARHRQPAVEVNRQ